MSVVGQPADRGLAAGQGPEAGQVSAADREPEAGQGPEAGSAAGQGPEAVSPAGQVSAALTGKRPAAGIGVRPAAAADAVSIAAIYAPVVASSAISFEEAPPGPDEISRRMLGSPRLPWLVADDAGRVAGYAYASVHRARPAYRWSADCSVYLDPGYRGLGIGRLLYEHLIGEVRDLGYVSLFAGIALPNAASVGLHEAVGFRPVGVFRDVGYKFGAWRDVGWWQLRLRDLPADPGEPRSWAPAAASGRDAGRPRAGGPSREAGRPRAGGPGRGEAGGRGQS